MKHIPAHLILLVCLFVSCKKNNTPTVVLNEMTDTAAVLTFTGNFSSGPYGTVTGRAEIYKTSGTTTLKLADFNSSNGPALHVFISKEATPINYQDLGALKSTAGNQVYDITGMPDFLEYKYVSIHCVEYNHLFGSALLQ